MAEKEADNHQGRKACVPHQIVPDIDRDALVPIGPGKHQHQCENQNPHERAHDLHRYRLPIWPCPRANLRLLADESSVLTLAKDPREDRIDMLEMQFEVEQLLEKPKERRVGKGGVGTCRSRWVQLP